MAVRTSQPTRSSHNLADKPERIGPALAQLVHVNADQDMILGQAWLAAPHQLMTCGHVVEQFAQDPTGLFVYFPSSGKRYPVKQVRLHPSFVRQPDGMVKFDAAVVTVQLTPPDSLALPLPFTWEQELNVNERLWTIRYPAHLSQYSSALQPLPQDGRFLGYLRKHDNFHLLHDVALAPGDSGAPLTDGRVVVAMHCGDTASLPGLNLPTTSIRLGLWIDAIKDLGLQQTRQSYISRQGGWLPVWLAFILSIGVGFGIVTAVKPTPSPQEPVVQFAQPALSPVKIWFNKPPDAFKKGESIEMTIDANSDCYPFVFMTDGKAVIVKMLPTERAALLKKGDSLTLDGFQPDTGNRQTIAATDNPIQFWTVVAAANDPASKQWALEFMNPTVNPSTVHILLKPSELEARINKFQTENPGAVAFHKFTVQAIEEKK